MAKVFDLTNSDGDFIILGRALVLPSSSANSQPHPFNGSLRFNPLLGAAQLFNDGSWYTLGEASGSAPTPGDGTSNNHSHSIAQITGLQAILNGKAPLIHTHGINDITGLAASLANKAEVTHTHTMAAIAGLAEALNQKAAASHTHSFSLREMISGCFPANPPANFNLVYTAAIALEFPINFVGSFVKVAVPPALPYTIALLKNGANVGSIRFFPSGQTAFELPAALSLAPGDTLTFRCPARDTALDTISFSLVGSRANQIIGA